MKNILVLTFMLFAFSNIVSAQIEKGTIGLGGDLNYNSTTSDFGGGSETTSTRMGIDLGLGYFVAKNLSIGAGIGYFSTSTEQNNITVSQNEFVFGAIGTYYVEIGGDFYLPLSASFGYRSITIKEPGSADLTIGGVTYGLRAGIEYLVNQKIGVRISLGPSFGSLGSDDLVSDIDYSLWDVGLGGYFYF